MPLLPVQVVLRKDVVGLGKTGELTKVPNGYYRNFLKPQGLAAPATEGILACAAPLSVEIALGQA